MRWLFSLLCACAFAQAAAAHVLDQYLQVAQVAIAPDSARIDLRLTPGVQVADRIFALIDVDGDGRISSAEEQAYARRVLSDVSFEIDGQRVPLALVSILFPSRREMSEGVGAIRLTLAAEANLGAAGEHQLFFRNDHLPELGAYLANALVPTTEAIKVTGQQRDPLQHGLQIDFRVHSADASAWLRWTGALLFVCCLALLAWRWKRLRRFEGGHFNAKKTFS